MTVDELLADHQPGVEQVSRWALEVLVRALPDATQTVWPGWHGVGLRHPRAGHVVGLFPREDEAYLFFEHGGELADPDGLLEPAGTRGRRVTLRRVGDPSEQELVALVDAAVELREGGPRRVG